MFKNISKTFLSCASCFSWLRTTPKSSNQSVATTAELVFVPEIINTNVQNTDNNSLTWNSLGNDLVFVNPVPINNELTTFNPFVYLGERSLQYPQIIDLAGSQIPNFNPPFVSPVRITNQDLAPHQNERMSPPPSPRISARGPGFISGPPKARIV